MLRLFLGFFISTHFQFFNTLCLMNFYVFVGIFIKTTFDSIAKSHDNYLHFVEKLGSAKGRATLTTVMSRYIPLIIQQTIGIGDDGADQSCNNRFEVGVDDVIDRVVDDRIQDVDYEIEGAVVSGIQDVDGECEYDSPMPTKSKTTKYSSPDNEEVMELETSNSVVTTRHERTSFSSTDGEYFRGFEASESKAATEKFSVFQTTRQRIRTSLTNQSVNRSIHLGLSTHRHKIQQEPRPQRKKVTKVSCIGC